MVAQVNEVTDFKFDFILTSKVTKRLPPKRRMSIRPLAHCPLVGQPTKLNSRSRSHSHESYECLTMCSQPAQRLRIHGSTYRVEEKLIR